MIAASVYDVQKMKSGAEETGPAGLDAFRLQRSNTINPRTMIRDPQVTLHSLDNERGLAVFVSTPSDVDLTQEPFYYVAQRNYARQIFTVPFEDLPELADDVQVQPGCRVSVFNTGRCGSTLLTGMFGSVSSCLSLSEPHAYLDLAQAGLPPEEEEALLRAATILYYKPREAVSSSHLVLKYDGRCTGLAARMHHAFPDEVPLFLYRNAYDVVASNMRLWCRRPHKLWYFHCLSKVSPLRPLLRPIAARKLKQESRLLPLMAEYSATNFTREGAIGILTQKWLAAMDSALDAIRDARVPFVAFRYKELKNATEQVLRRVFKECGLNEEQAKRAREVIDKGDSQRGTQIAKDRQTSWKMSQRDRETVDCVISRHPTITSAEMELPGTVLVS